MTEPRPVRKSQPLPKAVLGRTGLEVTRLGYGAAFRKRISEEHADRLLNEVIDAGLNFLDTANDYLDSEVRIGRALSHRYGEIHLSTKCGCTERREPHHVNGSIHEWTRDNLYRGVEQSLERLNRDSLEMVQLHSPTVEECERGRLVETLADMRSSGLVGWTGISTELPTPAGLPGVGSVRLLPGTLLGGAARARALDRQDRRGGRRGRRPGRRPARGTGAVGRVRACAPCRADGRRRDHLVIHAPLCPGPPRYPYPDRRHHEPGPPEGERRGRPRRPPARRRLRRSPQQAGRRRRNPAHVE